MNTLGKGLPPPRLLTGMLLAVSLGSFYSCRSIAGGSGGNDEHALFVSVDSDQTQSKFSVVTETGEVVWTGSIHGREGTAEEISPRSPLQRDMSDGQSYLLLGNKTKNSVGIDQYGHKFDNPEGRPFANYAEDLAPAVSAIVNAPATCGYVDRSFKARIPFSFDECAGFSEGLAAVRRGNKWGFVDKTGKLRIRFQYSKACAFSEDVAEVTVDKHSFVIDRNSKTVFALDDLQPDCTTFASGRLPVFTARWNGYLDHSGKFVIGPKYHELTLFSEGFAFVRYVRNGSSEVKLIDINGKEVPVSGGITEAQAFTHGLCAIGMPKGLYGLIDRTGHFVTEPSINKISDLHDGYRLMTVVKPHFAFVFLNPEGKVMKTPNASCSGYRAGVFTCMAADSASLLGGLDFLTADGRRIGSQRIRGPIYAQ